MGLRHRFDDKEPTWISSWTARSRWSPARARASGWPSPARWRRRARCVVAGARTTDALEGLDGVIAVAVDLAADDGPALLVQRAVDEHGGVDVLVNNVGGVRLRLDGFLGTSDAEFEWAMRMNFFTALRACRAAIPEMVTRGGGAIVNVASVNAFFQPDAGTIDYGAAKAALLNLTSRWRRSSARRAST